ncbi:MAG TPA: hypothetical protein VGD27_00410 [Longimicrobiales bacterium]
MPERRYKEEEVRKIIALATSGKVAEPPAQSADGFTLADVQSIGQEVGLEPELVARAAAMLDAGPAKAPRTSLGMPIEVGHNVPLPRALTDHEWAQLVAELRRTFHATGKVTELGDLRQWSNGNLHICVEPTEQAYRLRMSTVKGDANGINALGVTGIVASVVSAASLLFSGEPQGALIVPTIFGAGGAAAFLTNMLRLPRWRSLRSRQMDQLARNVQAMMAAKRPDQETPAQLDDGSQR